ncbi:MAG: prolipoprotein diacylglyceryl transferase [Candidatus Desulfofervidaceae bacterium]|nr:prolipoprotein diacylglyceryl transferase [Candidatus Desulfofervidaceae bacterium]MDL1971169.1 prolipoprotein diacylglyceryl transferase [Candidatus Desulfofervidaceae bacterium]
MHPILFHLGPLTIYTYGFWVAIGFFAALAFILSEAKREQISPSIISDLAFWCVMSGILGARLLYVFYNFSYFSQHPLEIPALWKGGLVFIGGVCLALLSGVIYVRRYHLDFWQLADLIVPGLALGQAFGRIGCFSAGCCYGKPTHVPWAVVFKDPFSLAPTGIPLHPTQLYHSLACFVIAFILIWIRRRYFTARLLNPTIKYGQVFGLYLTLHSIQRFIIEFFRGDQRPAILGTFSFTQLLALILALAGVIIFIARNKKS